jgi:hypothetical protein
VTRPRSKSYSRDKGAEAERGLCKYLRKRGWAKAERMVRTGFRTKNRQAADPGDVANTPGVVWSMKDVAKAAINAWMAELDAMEAAPTDIRLLVHKRAGYADAGDWWCWMRKRTLLRLLNVELPASVDLEALVRMELRSAVDLLEINDLIPKEEEAA